MLTNRCHYDGTDTILQIPESANVRADFIEAHFQETSFHMGRAVKVASLSVTGRGSASSNADVDFEEELLVAQEEHLVVKASRKVSAYFEFTDGGKRLQTPMYRLSELPFRAMIPGPAILVDNTQTIVVEPGCVGRILPRHVIVEVGHAPVQIDEEITPDPITLAVFANRFMSIAEQMGILFERTSISLSIKERQDFSCSIHNGEDGGLVVNAPHIPIHLGSMADAVRKQHEIWRGRLKPGDVLMTNHPDLGGTHLPDITVVTPIFDPADESTILFYMASRGHHSDIGGSGVTSMNPISRYLWEEGMNVKSFKIVGDGVFDEEGVVRLFEEAGEYPGCSASRRIDHNLTDLRAAVSANQRGATLMKGLFNEFGTAKVIFYMKHIQTVATRTVTAFLKDKYAKNPEPLEAEDWFDDGTNLKLKITINPEGTAVFDWTGSGLQMHGNFNIPISISYASILCE